MAKTKIRYVYKHFRASDKDGQSTLLDINDKLITTDPLPDAGQVKFTRVRTNEVLTCDVRQLRSCTAPKSKPRIPLNTPEPEPVHACKGCRHEKAKHTSGTGGCNECICPEFKP